MCPQLSRQLIVDFTAVNKELIPHKTLCLLLWVSSLMLCQWDKIWRRIEFWLRFKCLVTFGIRFILNNNRFPNITIEFFRHLSAFLRYFSHWIQTLRSFYLFCSLVETKRIETNNNKMIITVLDIASSHVFTELHRQRSSSSE